MSVSWHPLPGDLAQIAHYTPPTYYPAERALRQLRHVERLVARLGAKSAAVEGNYVDRDFVDDHSAYYSKSLHPYTGYCHRIHFFTSPSVTIRDAFAAITRESYRKARDEYRQLCARFSAEHYLGFCVIRPLPGSPVGRTVLTPPTVGSPEIVMGGVRTYHAHLLGIELAIRGLAFQQQDLGVSACATTAVWSSLQKMQEFEDIAAFTPAAITTLASRYSLAHGRMMPAEGGLNIDQMCQAVQGAGASPSLLRMNNLREARVYLHAAIGSGFAPVLVGENSTGDWHAVTAAGMETSGPGAPEPTASEVKVVARSSRLQALYLHDDRVGPYVRAELAVGRDERAAYTLTEEGVEQTQWDLRYLIVPMHAKLRLSFDGLVRVAEDAVIRVSSFWGARVLADDSLKALPNDLSYEIYVSRLHLYIEGLVREGPGDAVESLCDRVTFPRYVGVVCVRSAYADPVDLLVDTTDTYRNVRCLAVVARGQQSPFTLPLTQSLATAYGCWPVAPPLPEGRG